MLDIKYIREHKEKIQDGANKKRIPVDLDALLEVDAQIKPLQIELENLQRDRNQFSKTIAQMSSPEERETLKKKVQDMKSRMEFLEKDIKEKKIKLDELMLLVPQPARDDVPVGKDDKDNVEIKRWGNTPNFSDFNPLDHVSLGQKLGIIDIDRGVKLAGSRSYILKGDGALLENAVMRYTLEKLSLKGYIPFTVPVLVKDEAMVGTGYFPTGREQAYYVEKDQMALVGTGEVSLTSYFSDEILQENQLPYKMTTWSTCFRREAGTYGKDTHGLYRVHQFQKIEQVILCQADEKISEQMHDELLTNAEGILQDFKLPYRVVYVCTGDLGQGQIRKHDIETWMPSRNAYSETHSCSTFHEFQSRRLKMRYRDYAGKVQHCHTLNNTAIASPRILIAILENYQEKDGRVKIPEVLRSYMGGRDYLKQL